MSKKTKGTILFFVIWIAIIVLAWIGINALDGDRHYDSSLCTICHQNQKMTGKSYCYSCFLKAQQKVEEKNKNSTGASIKPAPDPVKTPSNTSNSSSNAKTNGSSSKTTSGSSSSGSYSKTTSGSSSKKEYNTLNYDPDDYDDPDDYAEDAWDEDFDDYDEAYEYWEDW